jgi:hypothetical protein
MRSEHGVLERFRAMRREVDAVPASYVEHRCQNASPRLSLYSGAVYVHRQMAPADAGQLSPEEGRRQRAPGPVRRADEHDMLGPPRAR